MTHYTDPFENLPSRVKPSSTFQTSEVSDLFADDLFADGLFANGLFASSLLGATITNTNASADAGNRYNVCMRTGFRVKPGELVEDAYGALVRPESFDKRHPQEFVRPLAEELRGPKRPEPTDQFLSASVSPEDL